MNERMQAAPSEGTLEIATPADVTAIRGDRRRLAVVPRDIFLSTAIPRRSLYGRLAWSLTDARKKNAALEKQTAELARLAGDQSSAE
jgi:hypothetical protein